MNKVRAIVIHEFGEPAAVARVEEVELLPLQPDEARVRVLLAPINPADLNVLEGKYPIRPALPGVPGVEGVGVVVEVGGQVSNLEIGSPVLLPGGFGSWRAAGNAKAAQLIPVPKGVPLEQAAMLRINPPTALCMLREFASLQPGEWVLQNAANSGVGRSVIQIARQSGWRTVNVVRRPELVEELKALGADVVLVEGGDLAQQITAVTGDQSSRLALNAVGGDSATRLASVLAPGGSIVTYGAMARQPLRIPNGQLIFQDITWRGFWVTRWYQQADAAAQAQMFARLFELAAAGLLHTPVEATYPLEAIQDALAHAARSQRAGKVLLRCSDL